MSEVYLETRMVKCIKQGSLFYARRQFAVWCDKILLLLIYQAFAVIKFDEVFSVYQLITREDFIGLYYYYYTAFGGSIPGRVREIFLLATASGPASGPTQILSNGFRGLFPRG
jgi:hypothetical protein